MAQANTGYRPPPGAQQPQKYPRVGPNYLQYGEQPGWTYSPRDDKYYRDQQSREELQRYEEEAGLRTKPPKQPGLGETILPIAATGVTVAGAQEIGRRIPGTFDSIGKSPPATTTVDAPVGQTQTPTAAPSATPPSNQGLLGASSPTTATPGAEIKAPNMTPTQAPVVEVGTGIMPDGSPGTLMSDGGMVGQNGQVINPDGTVAGSIGGQVLAGLQIIGGAAQAYNGYRQFQKGEKLGGAANMAGGAFGAAAGAQSLAAGGTAGSLSGYIPGVGAAVAGAQIGQQMLNDKGSSEDRAAASQYEAQKAALLFIPGYGWVAYAALAGLDAATGGKAGQQIMRLNKNIDKFNDRIDFGLGKNIRSKVFHQSTRGVQQMHTGQLLQQSDDPTWTGYVQGMRAQHEEGPADPSKPFAGKYATWEEYKKAGLEADNLTGVYGNLDAFKPDYAEKAGVPDWSKLTFDQQKNVTQRLINEGLYSSKKGEVVIGDKEKARRIYEEMSKNNFAASGAPAPTPIMGGAAGPAPIPPGQTADTVAAAPGLGASQANLATVTPGTMPQPSRTGLLGAVPPSAITAQAPNLRSNTRSPGIDNQGRRIRY